MIMAGVIVLHKNPFADPQEELLKKVISCVIIIVASIVQHRTDIQKQKTGIGILTKK